MIHFKSTKRRSLFIGMLLLALFFADTFIGKSYIVGIINTRTASFDIGDGLKLNFSVHWGSGMDQTISISRYFHVFASQTEKVYRKPNWAGGPIYTDKNKSHYYMLVRGGPCTQECYTIFDIDAVNKTVSYSCDIDKSITLGLDYFGQFSIINSWSLSGRGGGVSFTPAGEQPDGFDFHGDTRKLKRWCDD